MFFSDYRCHYAIDAYRADVTRRRAREMFEHVIKTRRREERYMYARIVMHVSGVPLHSIP